MSGAQQQLVAEAIGIYKRSGQTWPSSPVLADGPPGWDDPWVALGMRAHRQGTPMWSFGTACHGRRPSDEASGPERGRDRAPACAPARPDKPSRR